MATSGTRPLAATDRLIALDGLRGIAALAVVLHHYLMPPGTSGVDQVVRFFLYPGWAGVDLFFVLSGFLITGILYDTRDIASRWRTFYLRRALRIFPMYYAALIFLLLVAPRLSGLIQTGEMVRQEPIYAWLYMMNFQVAVHDAWPDTGFGVGWTLAIEEQFYLLWPVVVFSLERRWLLRVCVGTIGFAIAWRCALLVMGASPNVVAVLTPARLDSLAVGAWIALMARGPNGIAGIVPLAKKIFVASVGILLSLAISDGGLHPDAPAIQAFGYSLLAAAFGAVLVAAVVAPPKSRCCRFFSSPLLRTVGKYSYAIYLLHRVWQEVLDRTLFSGPPLDVFGSHLVSQLLYYAAGLGGSIALAYLSWNLLERHFCALKRLLPYETPFGRVNYPQISTTPNRLGDLVALGPEFPLAD